MPCYFFSEGSYIRVTRPYFGPGSVDPGYPGPISNWGWGNFGKNGIDAALYSGPVDYFFSGPEYIRVHRGTTGPGKVDPGYPKPIANWGWGDFGKNGIDAALWSDAVCYFFKGPQYIRVSRADQNPGKVDPGYPKPISNWGWGNFGKNGIDAALNSGPVDYFFSGDQYIRVSRGDFGPGSVDSGYPASISHWGWKEFGANGIKGALFSGVDFTDPSPDPATLASSSNYTMSDGGNDLTNVEVTIDLYQDMIVAKNGLPQQGASQVYGFTVQLNCYSPKNETDAWQQYVIGYNGSSVYAQINNWLDQNPFKFLINQIYSLVDIAGNKLSAGSKLRIILQNDSSNNVSGVTFEIRDGNGKIIGSHAQTLTDISGISTTDLAPIVAFQLVIVGPGNSESATFSSGSGTMIMQCSQALTATTGLPSDSEITWGTAESANTTYTRLSSTAGTYFCQNFGIDTTTSAVPTTVRRRLRPIPAPTHIPA